MLTLTDSQPTRTSLQHRNPNVEIQEQRPQPAPRESQPKGPLCVPEHKKSVASINLDEVSGSNTTQTASRQKRPSVAASTIKKSASTPTRVREILTTTPSQVINVSLSNQSKNNNHVPQSHQLGSKEQSHSSSQQTQEVLLPNINLNTVPNKTDTAQLLPETPKTRHVSQPLEQAVDDMNQSPIHEKVPNILTPKPISSRKHSSGYVKLTYNG